MTRGAMWLHRWKHCWGVGHGSVFSRLLMVPSLGRVLAVFVAFAAGWMVYMVAMVLTVYDGLLSLIFQPIMAALWSAFAVFLSLLVGLVLRVGPLSRVWNGSRRWAALIIVASLFVLIFGYFLGLTDVGIEPESEAEVVILHPVAALTGYFLLVFSIANWPIRTGRMAAK